MKKKTNKTFFIVSLLMVLCTVAIQASAQTINFSNSTGFGVDTGWLTSTDGSTPYNDVKWYQNGSTPVAPPSGYYNTIAWGVSNNAAQALSVDPFGSSDYSALKVSGNSGTVDTGSNFNFGNWATISTLYHQNNSISASFFTLSQAYIYSQFTIGGGTDNSTLPLSFMETYNSPPCAGPGGMGICPDVFTVPTAAFNTPIMFSYDGRLYEAGFQLANFINSTLVSNGDMHVWTAEGVLSSMDVQMHVREVVPEPGTMMLLGIGLLGLAVYGKRRLER